MGTLLAVRVFWLWERLYELRDVKTIVSSNEGHFTGHDLLGKGFWTFTARTDSRRIWWQHGKSIGKGKNVVLAGLFNIYCLYVDDDNWLHRKVRRLKAQLPLADTYVACRVSAKEVRDRKLAYLMG